MNRYFSMKDKVYDVTEKYPKLIDFLASKGFENLKNEMMRKTIGRTISLEMAIRSKHYDPERVEREMVELIEEKKPDFSSGLTEAKRYSATARLSMEGVLPCPVKLQFLEQLENYIGREELDINLDLQSASMGLGHIEEKVKKSKSAEELADIYMSAGYNLFFDRNLMGKYMNQGVFKNITGLEHINRAFENEEIDLRDPLGRYFIIGVVPAIFIVNTEVLGDRKIPRSWADLLDPGFENSISLPVKDLDLFNAVMLGMHKLYGMEGIGKLGRGLLEGMHPAQMVKGVKAKTGQVPAVSILPYFFAWMAQESSSLKIVWPKEGAIISPIFLMMKESSKEYAKPLVDFLLSKEVGEALHADGKFPTTNPLIENPLEKEQKFIWPGWDFLHGNDIGKLLKELEEEFFKAGGNQ
ncbi:MAG: ABC transporter substrate-binding protein [Johnsonella sp.]|nr:ABC transporter substrate-binding protein [Johnsonella sp.]